MALVQPDFPEKALLSLSLSLLSMQDVSCNEITALPQQIGQLKSLRELNVRRNYLEALPQGTQDGGVDKRGDLVVFCLLCRLCLPATIHFNLNVTCRQQASSIQVVPLASGHSSKPFPCARLRVCAH